MYRSGRPGLCGGRTAAARFAFPGYIASRNNWRAVGNDKTVVVSMVVDKAGKPTNLKITKSAGLELDQNVLSSVAEYRFKPGTLNNKPTALEVNLEIIVHAPGHE